MARSVSAVRTAAPAMQKSKQTRALARDAAVVVIATKKKDDVHQKSATELSVALSAFLLHRTVKKSSIYIHIIVL